MHMPAIRSHPKRWTAYDVRALMEASPSHWPRYETIDGDLIVSPAPRLAHQLALELLRDVLGPYIKANALGLLLASPADIELEKDALVQPDLFVVPASLGRPKNWEDISALLLAIEVLSPSTRRHDRVIKRRFFQRMGVPEYWTVDTDRRVLERWTARGDRPETIDRLLTWHPPGPNEPLVVDIAALFASIDN
jgi:Uma2 family endonuclease